MLSKEHSHKNQNRYHDITRLCMGGTKSEDFPSKPLEIWNGHRNVITHIPGVENVLADLRSRKFKDQLEWTLNVQAH